MHIDTSMCLCIYKYIFINIYAISFVLFIIMYSFTYIMAKPL